MSEPPRIYQFHIDADGDWWSDGRFLDDPQLRDHPPPKGETRV